MRILYVEDDPHDADLTVRALRKSTPHFRVETVSTIGEALARLERIDSDPLDLVFADVRLRDGDGLSLLRHVRERGLPVAVVFITGMRDEETAVAALKVRADDYVVKRKDYLDRLPVLLESALSHHRADVARRAYPGNILYAEDEPRDTEHTRRHFAVHAEHLQLDLVHTVAEDALWESEEFNRRIVESSSDCIKILDLEGMLLFISPRGEKLLGIEEPGSYINGSWLDLWPGDGRQAARTALEQAKQGGVGAFQAFGPTPQGRPKWWDTVIMPMTDARARVVRLLAISRDITESKQTEDALRQRDHLLRAIFNSLSSEVAVLDREGVITYVSRSWAGFAERNQGRPECVGLGVNYLDVCRAAAGDDPTASEALEGIEAVIAGERLTFSIEYPCHSPTEQRWFLMQVDLMPPEHDGVVISHTNITERKLAEEALKRALEEVRQLKDRLQEENIYLQEEVRVASDFGEIIGSSRALNLVLREAERVAPADTTVLILGETGTGKELLAHAVHNLSPRNRQPLVKLNCAALPATLIESELFGHEKGAFTGAVAQRRGRFELADGGTLFLDEVGELPRDLQAKLLRVLDEGEFDRVGGSRTLKVDVRVIAATNRKLEDSVRKGTFRSDLYYRLSVYAITLPPLRERREDIPMLVTHFVRNLSTKMGKEIETIPQHVMTALKTYPWPGNIRELRNVIERAVIITQGPTLLLTDDLGSGSEAGHPRSARRSAHSRPSTPRPRRSNRVSTT
jgi:PAS domain S-box-containing protein